MKLNKNQLEYGDIINCIKSHPYIETRMDLIHWLVGYYKVLTEKMLDYVDKAYRDGFLKN